MGTEAGLRELGISRVVPIGTKARSKHVKKGVLTKNPRGCCRDAGPNGTGRAALGPAGWSRWEPKQEQPETLDQSRQIPAHVR